MRRLLKLEGITHTTGTCRCCTESASRSAKAEIVTIVGANGAGKTTTINAICGLVECRTAGRSDFSIRRWHTMAAHRRVEMGLVQVPEGRRLFAFMTVQENIDLGCYTRGLVRRSRPRWSGCSRCFRC